jgi:hypothetical protein
MLALPTDLLNVYPTPTSGFIEEVKVLLTGLMPLLMAKLPLRLAVVNSAIGGFLASKGSETCAYIPYRNQYAVQHSKHSLNS